MSKREDIIAPTLFVKDEKTGHRQQQVGKLPPFLDSIKPIAPGKPYRALVPPEWREAELLPFAPARAL